MFLYRTKWGITLKNYIQENADNTAIALIKYNAKYNTSSWLLEPQSVIYIWFPSDITDKLRSCPALCSAELWGPWFNPNGYLQQLLFNYYELNNKLLFNLFNNLTPSCYLHSQDKAGHRSPPATLGSRGRSHRPACRTLRCCRNTSGYSSDPNFHLNMGWSNPLLATLRKQGDKQHLGCFHENSQTGSWQAAALCFQDQFLGGNEN